MGRKPTFWWSRVCRVAPIAMICRRRLRSCPGSLTASAIVCVLPAPSRVSRAKHAACCWPAIGKTSRTNERNWAVPRWVGKHVQFESEVHVPQRTSCRVRARLGHRTGAGVLVGVGWQRATPVPERVTTRVIDDGAAGGPKVGWTQTLALH
jgi:hypothetical protein